MEQALESRFKSMQAAFSGYLPVRGRGLYSELMSEICPRSGRVNCGV